LEEEINNALSSFIEETKPDIIHTHNMHYFSEVHIRILEGLAKKKGIPLILTAHNVWDDILFLELIHKIDWSHIIAVSHFIKREIIGVGIDDTRITVIHHGVDEDKFNPGLKSDSILKKFPRLKGRKIIFHPARIGLAKGCDTSIKAINLVREDYPDVMLVLAGSKNIIDWGLTQQKDIAYLVSLIKHFNLCALIVLMIITISCHTDQFLTYHASSLTRCSKLVPLRPLTCHNPVIPGVPLSRSMCHEL